MRFFLTRWGRGAGRSQQNTPCHPDKELEKTQGNLPIFLGQACRGRGGSLAVLPSIPHVVPLPADGKYWCCDFINKGFCEPEKHGIRMNYFLSCGLARFANLGVFGPSPGNKPKSLSKRHRCSREGEKKPRNDAPFPPVTLPSPWRLEPAGVRTSLVDSSGWARPSLRQPGTRVLSPQRGWTPGPCRFRWAEV